MRSSGWRQWTCSGLGISLPVSLAPFEDDGDGDDSLGEEASGKQAAMQNFLYGTYNTSPILGDAQPCPAQSSPAQPSGCNVHCIHICLLTRAADLTRPTPSPAAAVAAPGTAQYSTPLLLLLLLLCSAYPLPAPVSVFRPTRVSWTLLCPGRQPILRCALLVPSVTVTASHLRPVVSGCWAPIRLRTQEGLWPHCRAGKVKEGRGKKKDLLCPTPPSPSPASVASQPHRFAFLLLTVREGDRCRGPTGASSPFALRRHRSSCPGAGGDRTQEWIVEENTYLGLAGPVTLIVARLVVCRSCVAAHILSCILYWTVLRCTYKHPPSAPFNLAGARQRPAPSTKHQAAGARHINAIKTKNRLPARPGSLTPPLVTSLLAGHSGTQRWASLAPMGLPRSGRRSLCVCF